VFQERLSALPLATYKIGETVLASGSRTGRLLILKKGAVTIIKDDHQYRQGDRAWRRVGRTLCVAGSAAHCGRACH
jgi:hypothetical protein